MLWFCLGGKFVGVGVEGFEVFRWVVCDFYVDCVRYDVDFILLVEWVVECGGDDGVCRKCDWGDWIVFWRVGIGFR